MLDGTKFAGSATWYTHVYVRFILARKGGNHRLMTKNACWQSISSIDCDISDNKLSL